MKNIHIVRDEKLLWYGVYIDGILATENVGKPAVSLLEKLAPLLDLQITKESVVLKELGHISCPYELSNLHKN